MSLPKLVLLSVAAALVAAAFAAADPAALIRVTASGEVGVLLDEYPADVRDRVAAWALARPDSYWTESAVRQNWLGQYRLIYRAAWFGSGSGKRSLPLPMDQLTISFTSAAERKNENGHDVVKRQYNLLTYIVTGTNDAVYSDPNLGNIGGWVQENFMYPTDPYLVFQRTGYACMDEAQYPLGSADGENMEYYYDDTCGVESGYDGNGGCNLCHCTTIVDETCRSALGRYVGKTPVTYVYTRIPYDAALVSNIESRAPYNTSNTFGADLQGSLADLNHNYLTYRYVEPDSCTRKECIDQPGWRRLLNFDALHVNIGPKPLEIGFISFLQNDPSSFNPLVFHNLYYWDACHQHPHFSAYSTYSFNQNLGHKQGFCVLSTGRAVNTRWSPIGTANFDCSNQGIAPGWSDVYNAGIICQWVDVTNVSTTSGPKTAPLKMVSNPKNWLCEGQIQKDAQGNPLWEPTGEFTSTGQSIDKMKCITSPGALTNNVEETSFTLPTKGHGVLTRACDHVNHNLGPKRDCEFTIRSQLDSCTPGAQVNLLCSINSNKPSQVLRICESSIKLGSGTACRFMEPHNLGNFVITPGVDTPVSFTCPVARDAVEVGGKYSTYSAGVFNLDAAATITCSAA